MPGETPEEVADKEEMTLSSKEQKQQTKKGETHTRQGLGVESFTYPGPRGYVNEWVEQCVGPRRKGVFESGVVRTRYRKSKQKNTQGWDVISLLSPPQFSVPIYNPYQPISSSSMVLT